MHVRYVFDIIPDASTGKYLNRRTDNRMTNTKGQKDKVPSTKHTRTHKTKDRVTRTQLKTRGELR